MYLRAAVATDVPACSKVGVDILKLGGSVIDSAVAALFCLGVINFQSVGLGGGGFLLYYNATSHQPTFLDFREVAPNRATTDMFHQHGEAPNEGGCYTRGIQSGNMYTCKRACAEIMKHEYICTLRPNYFMEAI